MQRLFVFLVLVLFVLSACQSGGEETEATPVVIVKRLVTVEIPPTLNPQERLATQQALPRTPTEAPPTITPTPTNYVGVFIGAAERDDNLPPILQVNTEIPEDVTGCPIPIDNAFGTDWRTDPTLPRAMGCPIQERFGFTGDVQVFERGVMYRRQSTNEVWAVLPGRIDAGEYWYEDDIIEAPTEGISAPEGLRVPAGVLGAVWLQVADIRQNLGFANTPEQIADLNIQRFEGGTLFLDVTVGQTFVLLANGEAYGPFE